MWSECQLWHPCGCGEGDSFAEGHSGYPRQLYLLQSGARMITWGKIKNMEKTRNNGFHAFSLIPKLAFQCTASTLQLLLYSFLQRWRRWSGHWTRVFCIAHRLIGISAVLDHVDPGHCYSSNISFTEVLRPQSRNLPPTCPHCFCYICAHHSFGDLG